MGKLAGDFIKGITDALGLEQCAKCKKRQEKLNEIHRRLIGKPKKGTRSR